MSHEPGSPSRKRAIEGHYHVPHMNEPRTIKMTYKWVTNKVTCYLDALFVTYLYVIWMTYLNVVWMNTSRTREQPRTIEMKYNESQTRSHDIWMLYWWLIYMLFGWLIYMLFGWIRHEPGSPSRRRAIEGHSIFSRMRPSISSSSSFTATHCNTCMEYHESHLTATHCKTLQHTATDMPIYFGQLIIHCNTLQHMNRIFWESGTTLQHTAAHCNALQRTATHCIALHRTATQTYCKTYV